MLNIEILKGTRLNAIGRAAAMCWISLGNLIEIESRSGLRTVGQYALDVDCPWRIRCNSKILLASTDMFEPASTHQHDETFEWDIQGNNLFDERVAMLCNNEPTITVQSIELSSTNDLKIIFPTLVMVGVVLFLKLIMPINYLSKVSCIIYVFYYFFSRGFYVFIYYL